MNTTNKELRKPINELESTLKISEDSTTKGNE